MGVDHPRSLDIFALVCAIAASPGPKFEAGTPLRKERNVGPSELARTSRPFRSTNASMSGSPSPGRAAARDR